MPEIYVDADACPVKDEVVRVAGRHGLNVVFVSDGGVRPRPEPFVRSVFVEPGTDAADDWIAENIARADICITNDIPLAARCLERDAQALKPNGNVFTEDMIGMALANRSLMQTLRDTGEITGGPRPFGKADRSAFMNALEVAVQRAKRDAAT